MNIQASPSVRVFLIAPALVSWGLERLLQSVHPRFELAGSQPSIAQAQPDVERGSPHVIVIDLDGGYEVQALVELQSCTPARIVVLSSSQDVEMLDRCVVAGVRGVVKKTEPPPVLLKAIEKVHDGELWIDRGATNRIFMELARQKVTSRTDPETRKIAALTSRERQTICAVASDTAAPGKVIASRLCISEHTLRNHLTSIYSKLGLCNRLDLYAYATKHSLNKPG